MKVAKKMPKRHPNGFTPLRRYCSSPFRSQSPRSLSAEIGRIESFHFIESRP